MKKQIKELFTFHTLHNEQNLNKIVTSLLQAVVKLSNHKNPQNNPCTTRSVN